MKTTMKYALILVMAALPLISAKAEEAVLHVTPGNYLIKRETSSNADPNSINKDEEKCITDPVFNPVKALPPNGGCSASNVKKSGNTVTYDITCTGGSELPPLTGTAEYSSNGMAIGWNIVLKGEIDGKPMTIINKAEGKRIGDCTPTPQ
ncbi:MAG TPA: DUF3617 family protein [Thermodesulfobacteriota bacterium]|nr:DUF3617 family protein [Thermodesulfobacteriota bacterium]